MKVSHLALAAVAPAMMLCSCYTVLKAPYSTSSSYDESRYARDSRDDLAPSVGRFDDRGVGYRDPYGLYGPGAYGQPGYPIFGYDSRYGGYGGYGYGGSPYSAGYGPYGYGYDPVLSGRWHLCPTGVRTGDDAGARSPAGIRFCQHQSSAGARSRHNSSAAGAGRGERLVQSRELARAPQKAADHDETGIVNLLIECEDDDLFRRQEAERQRESQITAAAQVG